MKPFFGKNMSESGASGAGLLSVLVGLGALVWGIVMLYSYAMDSWRASSMIGELKQRSTSVLQTGTLAMKEFPENDCQGFPMEALTETTDETVYLFRVKGVDQKTCQLLLQKYPADWFYVFVNNQLDSDRKTACGDFFNTLDFAFMREKEKTIPTCADVHCYNGGTCLRGLCTCPNGVSGTLCTFANDCSYKENGTRCHLAGRTFDGVCMNGLCQNEGECPALNWDEAELFCQGHGGLPEVSPVYGVSGQIVDSNSNGYWMSYLKNPQTRYDYRRTPCFTDDAVVWTNEKQQNNPVQVWTVEMQSGHVVSVDGAQKHQVLCAEVFEHQEE